MIFRCALFIICLLALRGPVIAAEPAAPANSAEHQDVLLLGPLEPLRMRLAIEVDGVPFRKVWLDTFQRLFDLFDADRDGTLTIEQADKLTAIFARGNGSAPSDAKPSAGAMMMAKNLTRDDVRRRVELAAPPLSLRQRLSSQGAGPALIPLLDSDGDGRLSREELQSAEKSLHCRDFNDDQLITQQELIAGPSPTISAGGENNVGEGAVIILTEALGADAVVELLLARYDRNRDGLLALHAPAELISSDGGIAVLDADGDRTLTRQELRRFLDLPLDAELPLSFGATGTARKRGEAAPRYRLQRKLDGGYRLHVGSSEVNFRRNNRDPGKDDRQPRLKDFDADANDSLDENELMNVPDRPEFSVLDSDRDGKISAAEFDGFFLQRARVAAVQLVLEASDQGADLFTTLDRNFDRVLTPRELQAAPELLATEDRDGDGYLGGVEMSYSLVLELSRGGSRAVQNAPAGAMRTAAEPQVKGDRQGPAWFLKMDRNRDGDVSLLEFLGSRDTFRKLDKDANGLLSADEVP
jgi:Ca2+-binding EF-hand superfamily protein